jgi:hypothetical protein
VSQNVGSKARGGDHSGRIDPVQAADSRIISGKCVEQAVSILIGNRLGSGQSQAERQLVADETLQKGFKSDPDSTGKLQVGLHFHLFTFLKPTVKNICLQEQEGDKNDEQEQDHPLFYRHLGSKAEGIFHRDLMHLH